MRYDGCLLVVKDAQASKHFYESLLQVTTVHDLGVYVVFDQGFCVQQEETWLKGLGTAVEPPHYGHHCGELYFEEDELDAFVARLETFPGISILTPLSECPWGQRVIRFHDPDGHVVEVGESMRLVVKRFLRAGLSVEEAARRSMFPVPFVVKCRDEMKSELHHAREE